MQSKAKTVNEYIKELPADRAEAVIKLRETVLKNLPKGLLEEMNYGMIGYVVPHSIYPDGYHCDPKQPLPFVCIASQKNFISFYHMGVYSYPGIPEWFKKEYPKYSKLKPDMGKSCIRFKSIDQIPYKLIGELMKKISVKDYIFFYENSIKDSRKKNK